MNTCPCGECPMKGCGSYHSKCKEYIDWKLSNDNLKQKKIRDLEFKSFQYCIWKKITKIARDKRRK